ncbi:MAG: methylisocitrate lyase [Candidatus Thermoplasmatota archaeon]|nr:methylisocitrate lyase [Candidatus Thermoplasmatota archaeon]MCL5790417.1 methylisocitrate lyase [Candidatus Thermoplasmatota archaeon]
MSRLRDVINDGPAGLRKQLDEGIVVAPGVYSGVSAIIAEQSGFRAGYLSGSGVAGMMGLPDLGMTTLTEVADESRKITRITRMPLIVDCDTGFGETINVTRTVRMMEEAGVSAIHIEDQVLPKKCGHLNGKQVIPIEDMESKINAAVQARKNPDFLIIARTDSRSVNGLDEAIERSRLYLEAGADCIFTEALESEEEFREMRKKVPGLLLANMTEFGKTPLLSVKQLDEIGYNMVIFPLTSFRGILKKTEEIYRMLLENGTQRDFINEIMSRKRFYEIIGYSEYEAEDFDLSKRRTVL